MADNATGIIKPRKRWNPKRRENSRNLFIDRFIDEIEEVCKRHGFAIAHEDHHGAFIIEKFSDYDIEWLRSAHDETENE